MVLSNTSCAAHFHGNSLHCEVGSLQLWNGSQYSYSSLHNNLTKISVTTAKCVLVFMQKTICSWEDQSSVESSCLVCPFCWGVWLPALGVKQSRA